MAEQGQLILSKFKAIKTYTFYDIFIVTFNVVIQSYFKVVPRAKDWKFH